MRDVKKLAKELGRKLTDLLALAPQNDPYWIFQPARLAAAEWFARLFTEYGFGDGVRLRRIHYRIVSQPEPVIMPGGKPYKNTDNCWTYLGCASRDARYLSLIPAGCFEDHRNPDPRLFMPIGKAAEIAVDADGLDYIVPHTDFPRLPRLALDRPTVPPPYLVEVWVEKSTVDDVLAPLCERYGANLIIGAGEMSETATRLLIDRVKAAGRPARVLYISDFDPAGRSMPVAVARKVEYGIEGSNSVEITVQPIALTEEQCLRYGLPRTPIKETEARALKFEERFGSGATELDALEALHPGELARIVETELSRYLDSGYHYNVSLAVFKYQERLRRISEAVHEEHRDRLLELKAEYKVILDQLHVFKERSQAVFNDIQAGLGAVEIPEFIPPEHRPAREPDADTVLFDSRRDYIEQMRHYKLWQGRA